MTTIFKIPFVDLTYQNNMVRENVVKYMNSLIESSTFLFGKQLELFEKNYAEYVGSKKIIGVANGTDALEISLRALNVSKDQIVCIPALTFAATGIAAVRCNLKIILCDVDMKTGNISKENLDDLKIQPDLIIGVSLFGKSIDSDVMTWADKSKIMFLEDAAQSQGALSNGKKSGDTCRLKATSFYPTKNLGSFGDAGAIILNDLSLYSDILKLRNYGGIEKYSHDTFGFNSRMSEIQALVLNLKLNFLDTWNKQRIKIAKYYVENLVDVKEIIMPEVKFDGSNVFHLFPILTKKRDELRSFLKNSGIETGIHYPQTLNFLGAFKSHTLNKMMLPNAEFWAKNNITLPIYPGLNKIGLDYVINKIKLFFTKDYHF